MTAGSRAPATTATGWPSSWPLHATSPGRAASAAHAGVRGQRRASQPRHQRPARVRRGQSRIGGESGDDGQHRARRATELLAFAHRRTRRLPRSHRGFRRGADHGGYHQRLAISRRPDRSGRAPLRRQFRIRSFPHAERRNGGYAAIQGAKLTIMQAPPLYHTTGETLAAISTPGLERIARFFAYFVKEADKLRPRKSTREAAAPRR